MAMTLKVLRGQRNSRPKFQKKFNKVISFFRIVLEKKIEGGISLVFSYLVCTYVSVKIGKNFQTCFLADVLYMQYYIVQETNYSTQYNLFVGICKKNSSTPIVQLPTGSKTQCLQQNKKREGKLLGKPQEASKSGLKAIAASSSSADESAVLYTSLEDLLLQAYH